MIAENCLAFITLQEIATLRSPRSCHSFALPFVFSCVLILARVFPRLQSLLWVPDPSWCSPVPPWCSSDPSWCSPALSTPHWWAPALSAPPWRSPALSAPHWWAPALSAPPWRSAVSLWWSSVPLWRSSALPWWSSAPVWWSSALPALPWRSSAPHWWALVPSALAQSPVSPLRSTSLNFVCYLTRYLLMRLH